jgi:hypothetical protein
LSVLQAVNRVQTPSSKEMISEQDLKIALTRLRRFEVLGRTFILNVETGQTYGIGAKGDLKMHTIVASVDEDPPAGDGQKVRSLPPAVQQMLHQMGNAGVDQYLEVLRNARRRKTSMIPTAFTVNLTHACNLACRY